MSTGKASSLFVRGGRSPHGSAPFASSPLRPKAGSRTDTSSSNTSSTSSSSASSHPPTVSSSPNGSRQPSLRPHTPLPSAITNAAANPTGLLQPYLTSRLPRSSANIAQFQARWRTPWLDAYFLWSSMLGATSFFMTFLPAFFFFGFAREGRELLHVLAAGIYFSCLVKDLVQVSRPSSPPVTRLSLEYHALEYGFPSSHATTSTSLALHAALFLSRSELPLTTAAPLYSLLTIFWLSIVGGRYYCGMHTMVDIISGSALGGLLSGVAVWWEGEIEGWLASGGWHVPALVITTTFILSTHRPRTPVPCPCFGDGIAFLSVVAGCHLGHWSLLRLGAPSLEGLGRPASDIPLTLTTSSWTMYGLWCVSKYALGILVVIFYRILAKLTLPSIYSVLFGWSDAKTRRETDKAASALEVVPSVVDFGALGNSEGKKDDLPKTPEQDDAWRRGRIAKQGEGEVLKHGTEVLTKVLVYGGIGLLATELIPLAFVLSGVGLR